MADRHIQSDLFVVVGLAVGIAEEDEQYFRDYPQESERWRAYIPGEVAVETPGVTDIYIYERRLFDGTRTGIRHHVFLRRAERPR
jgi:hypothetical protein